MLSKLVWTNAAWSDYVYWQGQDNKTLKRINLLIKKLCARQKMALVSLKH
jgi:toxin YoeB